MNFLESILEHKKAEIAGRKKSVLRSQLEDMPKYSYPRLSLRSALMDKELAVIAEIKKASPSKNVIREQFDPLQLAREYMQGGASALSVLTDERFFQGRLDFIEKMRNFVSIPILMKDFVVDPYQLYEAKAFGADAVLLIVAALEAKELNELHDQATELGLECLVEVHSEEDIDKLDVQRCSLVGINNRDLMTFETDILTSLKLKKYLPHPVTVVSESGISSARDLEILADVGIHAVLIGEHFMRSQNPGKCLAELIAEATGSPS